MSDTRLRWIIAAAVFLVVFGVYLYAAAPTASFWDCSEFIAAAYTLGVPHPPGTPLFVMLGRLFALLPLGAEIAFRVNLISVLAGAAAAALAFLVILRLASTWKELREPRLRFVPYLAAVAGALFMAFAYTIWDNALEAEVYTTCAAIGLGIVYGALVWRERVEQGRGDNRLIVLALYLVFLGAAIHLTPVLILPAFLLFAYLVDRRAVLALRLLELFVLALLASLVAGRSMLDYLVLITASPAAALLALGSPRLWALIALVVLYIIYLSFQARRGRLDLRYVGLALGLVLLAGTVQFYLMIRAGHHPAINMSEPTNWQDFLAVLQRKQYEPMKLLPRKTQFLTEADYYQNLPHFNVFVAYAEQLKYYVRYFLWQWRWQSVVGFVPPLLGLVGGWALFKRDRKAFALLATAYLLASLGLLTYLNLKYSISDPRLTLQFREVRERDYFFAFSYVFYAVFAGLGGAGIAAELGRRLRARTLAWTLGAALPVVLALAFVPINYDRVTRRNNWVPAEYGYNFVASAERGIVFTNGDNDTYPLWFIKNVPSRYNGNQAPFHPELMVANLSLINIPWYINQLKDAGVPISFTRQQIDWLGANFRPFLDRDRRVVQIKDVMKRNIIATSVGIELIYPDDYGMSAAEFRAKVLTNYQPRYPVFFAITAAPDETYDVRGALSMEGMLSRVVRFGTPAVSLARTRELVEHVYRIVSISDPRVRRDENSRTVLYDYGLVYYSLAAELAAQDDRTAARAAFARAARLPLDTTSRYVIFRNLGVAAIQTGRPDAALDYLDTVEQLGIRDADLYDLRGLAYEQKRDWRSAARNYDLARRANPDLRYPVERLVSMFLFGLGDTASALDALRSWVVAHPADSASAAALRELEARGVRGGK